MTDRPKDEGSSIQRPAGPQSYRLADGSTYPPELPQLLRLALLRMAEVNALPLRTPLRYTVDFQVDEDGVVYMQHEECVRQDGKT